MFRTRPDAEAITVRDLRRDDGDVLDAIVARLSPRSRYLRFHSPIPVLSADMRQVLLDVDGRDRIAVVAATADGTPVGIAGIVRDPQRLDEAELAVTVVDAWHRRGVGRRLLNAVVERASASGVRRLTARVLDENDAALRLFRSLFPVSLTRRDDDALVLVALLDAADGAAWTITTEDVLADLAFR